MHTAKETNKYASVVGVLHSPAVQDICQKRPIYSKRGLYTSKETKKNEKKIMHRARETYTYVSVVGVLHNPAVQDIRQKRPTYSKRDQYKSKEIYIQQKM